MTKPGWGSRGAVYAALLTLAASAGATPPSDARGPLQLRLEYSKDTGTSLAQGALHLKDPLQLVVRFQVPAQGPWGRVWLILSPLGGTLQVEGQGQKHPNDSGIPPRSWGVELDLSSLQPGTEFTLPLIFTPTAEAGAGVVASLRPVGGGHPETAAKVLGLNAEKVLVRSSVFELNQAAYAALMSDPALRQKQLATPQVHPFNPDDFPSEPSPEVNLWKGGEP